MHNKISHFWYEIVQRKVLPSLQVEPNQEFRGEVDLFPNQYFSISSRVFPFVSGIIFQPIQMVGIQKSAKIQNVNAGPRLSSESGINCPIVAVPIQTAMVAMDMALPRMLVG